MVLRKRINAIHYKDMYCEHDHVPYRAKYGMPCTGPFECSMCNMIFDSYEEIDRARMISKNANKNILL